jgi:hypothetical protein
MLFYVAEHRKGALTLLTRAVASSVFWVVIFSIELVAGAMIITAIEFVAAGGLRSTTAAAVRVSGARRGSPRLVFACCETRSEMNMLPSTLSNPQVTSNLQELHAGVAVALTDLSADRAEVVRRLNGNGIPVTAWLLLPPGQGYYFNADNAPEAEARFGEFEKWTAENRLRWEAIGLDIEPSPEEFSVLKQGSKWSLFLNLAGRYLEGEPVSRAKRTYASLVKTMQARGYVVETYQLPFIVAEREAHTTLLERLLGVVDIRANVEVLMLYTSFAPSIGSAMIWVFGPQAQAITVGVTGGKGGLNWLQFSKDLIVANQFARLIGIFNLEGCVQQGFLTRLKRLNWDQSVTLPAPAVRKAILLHTFFPAVLWTASRLPYLAAVVLLVDIWWVWARRRKRSAGRST